jgi:O-methyltransferase
MDVLHALYDKLSPGGYFIVDDYYCIDPCKQAIDDFRRERGITDEIVPVDWSACYWKRSS